MIDVTIRNYIAAELSAIAEYATVPVLMEQPKTVPSEYVLLRRIDGGRTNQVDAVTFVIAARSTTMYKAAALIDTIKEILFDAIKLPAVTAAKLGGERIATDTANHIYQYELTFNFFYYREES